MAALLVFLVILVCAAIIAGPIIYLRSQRIFREQKNYERGLKMVPLLIHLPPMSEDIVGSGRDTRDLADENISKAQIIYNIVASTIQKGFKSRYYGQRHFAFEIIGSQGFVYFYAAVPIAMLDVVKQAIVSAYPAARLEEVAEHNIFNSVGKITSTIGGELNLKENFAYPIATFQDLKRDAMQSLLNALSTLDKEDGAGIQILMRPADSGWRKAASAVASKKRKGKESKGGMAGAGAFGRQLLFAAVKPPEHKDGKGDDKPDLSSLEQSTLDAIDEKTRHQGYEIMIRVVASSNISQRSQAILGNIIATFSLYDAPGKNGFKYTPAKDMEKFVTAYLMRFFPQQNKKNILNEVELATLFHFPDQRNIPTSQLSRQDSKQVDAPRNIPDEGLLMGYNMFRGVKKPIRLALGDRQRHMYAVGQTGTGKSTFLENLALQDMLNGDGFAFVDPHGDTVEKLLSMVPKERTEDVIYFSPAEMDYPMGLNLFEFNNPDQKDFLIQEALNMLYKLYDPQHQGIMGPRYEHLFRMAALTVMADPAGGTFIDIPKLFRDQKFVQQKLKYVTDLNVIEFWTKEIPQSQRSNEFGEVTSWFVSKFGAFLSNEMMRNIIGQTKSAFDLRDIMDNKKILLVNLSKGRLGELNSKLLGMIFVMKFQAAAMSRANIPEADRKDFALYVDEFQNFSTDSFATIMSEARKYHLNLIVANQFTTQLTPEIRDAVFGNMGTIVAFRIGQPDVEAITKYFEPIFDGEDLLRIPNHNAITRTLIGGVPTQPFSLATLPPLGTPNSELFDALKQLSSAKYGRPKKIVEAEIFERIATKPEPPAPSPFGAGGAANPANRFGAGGATPSPFGAAPGTANPAPGGAPGARPAAPGNASFLDEWLSKRQPGSPAGPTGATPAAPAAFATPATPTPVPMNGPGSQSFPTQQQPFASAQPAFNPAPAQPYSYPPVGGATPVSSPSSALSGTSQFGSIQAAPALQPLEQPITPTPVQQTTPDVQPPPGPSSEPTEPTDTPLASSVHTHTEPVAMHEEPDDGSGNGLSEPFSVPKRTSMAEDPGDKEDRDVLDEPLSDDKDDRDDRKDDDHDDANKHHFGHSRKSKHVKESKEPKESKEASSEEPKDHKRHQKNMSSDEIEHQEVEQIAEELKKGMQPAAAAEPVSEEPATEATTAPIPDSDAAVPAPEEPELTLPSLDDAAGDTASNEAAPDDAAPAKPIDADSPEEDILETLKIKRAPMADKGPAPAPAPEHGEFGHEDTIVIDQDGNMQIKSDETTGGSAH
jgi:hypothetical protein